MPFIAKPLANALTKTLGKSVAYAKSFPAPIWFLVAATTLESTGRFMVVPYLSLYLSGQGVSLGTLGLIIGAAPVASVIFGAVGGHLSDSWGRKPVQILGVASSGLALIGFALAGTNPFVLGLLNFLNGMTRTFYRPATSAAIADFSPPERLSEANALNRIALNAAFGWGPIIGLALFNAAPKTGFIIAGCVNLAVGLFLAFVVPESAPRRRGISAEEKPKAGGGLADWARVLSDGVFWLWILGNAVVWGAYDLIQSFLPIHLKASDVPIWVYGGLLVTNALVCVFAQLPASRLVRAAPIGPVAGLSKLAYVVGFVGFAWSRNPVVLIAAMLVLSFGEVIGSGGQVRFIPSRAPADLIGRYMGLSVMNELGRAFVAPAAGRAMETWGGEVVFMGAAILSVVGGSILWLADALRTAKPAAPRSA